MAPRTIWCAAIGTGLTANFIAWRRGEKATLCASTLRPFIVALGRAGEPAMWGGFYLLGRHIVKHR